jgi:hypothetical protein
MGEDRGQRTERQMKENALDLMASATKNAYLIGPNKSRKNRIRQANAAIYAFD